MYTNVITLVTQWLPLLYAIIGFGTLITVHEFGHFIFCKLFNIHTPTFSIGMGPTLIQKKLGDTVFKLAALPLGGYVEIAGHEEVGQGDQAHAHSNNETAFRTKPYWQKLLVMLGGIIFNLSFAYLVFINLLWIGLPKSQLQVAAVTPNSLAFSAGLKPNDIIVSIDNWNIEENPNELGIALQTLQTYFNKTVHIVVKRTQKTVEIPLHIPAQNQLKNTVEQKGKLGIEFAITPSSTKQKFTFKEAVLEGINRTNMVIAQTVIGLKTLLTSRSLKGAGGPIMIISQSVKQAQSGLIYLFLFLAIISINLAIMNLLPLPILDGGQLFFISVEALIGKEIPSTIKNGIFIGSWVGVLTLFLVLSYRDIIALLK